MPLLIYRSPIVLVPMAAKCCGALAGGASISNDPHCTLIAASAFLIKIIMRTLTINEFCIKYIWGSEGVGAPKSEIWINGQATGQRIPVGTVEAAVGWKDYYLIITSDSYRSEDFLDILLLNKQFILQNSACI